MTQRKKLIEVALPLEAINAASSREKYIRHGHPSTLHLWWARRPLATARAVIFTSLVDDPNSEHAPPKFVEACKQLDGNQFGYENKYSAENDTPRMRLFDFIAHLVTWESTTDEKMLEKARELIRLSTDGNPPPLLDPFAGGGSIPLEAQRLGLEAHASDLNPVAVMINKAQIEIPPRFSDMPPVNPDDNRENTGQGAQWKAVSGLAADVRYYGKWMRNKAYEIIGHHYPEIKIGGKLYEKYPSLKTQGFRIGDNLTVIAFLRARSVTCPNPACQHETPLISSYVLSSRKGREAYFKPIIENNTDIHFDVRMERPSNLKELKKGLKRGTSGIFECIRCGTITKRDYVAEEGLAGRLGQMPVAVVLEGNRQRVYLSPTDIDIPEPGEEIDIYGLNNELAHNPRDVWCRNFGLNTPKDLFTNRQLLSLSTFSSLLKEVEKEVLTAAQKVLPNDDRSLDAGGKGSLAYSQAVIVYLSFAIDKLADYNSALCSWHSGRETIRNTFGRQALPMVWDFAEANPFSDSTGNWLSMLSWVWKTLETLPAIYEANAIQTDAASLQIDNDDLMVSTDPPYYDNIGYADLSDFFYVWLRKSLRHIFPNIFGTMMVPKKQELVAIPYRFNGNSKDANHHFESGLKRTFEGVRDIIQANYPTTIYYAFKQSEVVEEGVSSTGWETMLQSLLDSSFVINGTWPVRTEMSTRAVASGTNALASSIVLVCRPRSEDAPQISRREFVSLLRQELPEALEEMQSGNIAPVDLAQASIGPGMAVYSRYSQVLEADGTPLTVRTALQIINQELDAYLSETEGHIDPESRFAVAWFEQNGFEEGDFGQADVLARAKNTSVAGIEDAHIIESGRGKVRLLSVHDLYEMNPDWNPADDKRATTWEAVHHLIARLQRYGESGAALLMLKMDSDMAAEARQLAYRLYSICERKGWADHARDYNAIVVQWSDIQSEVSTQREAIARGDATRQISMFDDE